MRLGIISNASDSHQSTIGNVTVSGTTSLNGSLSLSRTTGTVNLGALTISTNGTLNLTAGSEGNGSSTAENTITVTSLAGSAGTVQANKASTSGALVLSGNNTTTSFGGLIQNGLGTVRVVKQGNSTQILSGDNTYTGNTTVSAGTLLINGNQSLATGAVSVAVGATLGGNGTIGGDTTIRGNLQPGNSPGLLTFNGSLTLNSTSITTMEIDGTGRGTTYDAIDVGTSLAYGGNMTLDIGTTFGGGSYNFDLFDFGGESSDFNGIALSGTYSGALVFDTINVWTLVSGNETWTFTQSSGVLNLSVIPEPGTCILLGIGSAFMLWNLRRRRS